MDGTSSIPVITLECMPQQIEMLTPEENWLGLSSSAERRRIQNRLNQRARSKSLRFGPVERPSYCPGVNLSVMADVDVCEF